jgi:hypothetical protein
VSGSKTNCEPPVNDATTLPTVADANLHQIIISASHQRAVRGPRSGCER